MTKIDIISGFLGAGKTTLIKKLIQEAFQGEKLVLIENEFGEIAIDGGFLKDAGIEITEMNSGCICCSLVGDFGEALKKVLGQFHPDRILIEPSGVGKLSDVIRAVKNLHMEEVSLNSFTTVADAGKCKMYMKNFGEFYNNQVEHAGTILLSRTQNLTQDKLEGAVALLREKNPAAVILTTPWDQLDGKTILSAIEKSSLEEELLARIRADHAAGEEAHAHHHHDHGDHCGHGHCHDDEGHDHQCCHGGEHHGHGGHCHHDHEEHEHHHGPSGHNRDHDHGEGCACGCHDHHEHHHADEVFASWGRETVKPFAREELERILAQLDLGECGAILRAKGIVPAGDGSWLHFDYVPEEHEVRTGPADYTGRLCVIGAGLDGDRLAGLFGL